MIFILYEIKNFRRVLKNNQSTIAIKSPVTVSLSKLTGNVFIKTINITKVDQKRLETGYKNQSPNIFKSNFHRNNIIF